MPPSARGALAGVAIRLALRTGPASQFTGPASAAIPKTKLEETLKGIPRLLNPLAGSMVEKAINVRTGSYERMIPRAKHDTSRDFALPVVGREGVVPGHCLIHYIPQVWLLSTIARLVVID